MEKSLNEMTAEEIDAMEVELLSDDEIEVIENYVRSILYPEKCQRELSPRLRAKLDEKYGKQ